MSKVQLQNKLKFLTFYVNFGRDNFYQYGEIRNITLVPRQQCAFIQYTSRGAAEIAAERTFNKLLLQGRRVTIKWGRSQARQGVPGNRDVEGNMRELEPVPGLPGALPMPSEDLHSNFFNLGAGGQQYGLAANIPPMLMPPPIAGGPGSFFFPRQVIVEFF